MTKSEFGPAIKRLLTKTGGEVNPKTGKPVPPPKEKDLLKAFDVADADKSGVVDLEEFCELYHKVKAGEVKGLGGFSFSLW